MVDEEIVKEAERNQPEICADECGSIGPQPKKQHRFLRTRGDDENRHMKALKPRNERAATLPQPP
jgi:hypothetical protein